MVVQIEFVDYGINMREYGMFGKVVAKLDIRNLDPVEVEREVADMKKELGDHIVTREVEWIGPA